MQTTFKPQSIAWALAFLLLISPTTFVAVAHIGGASAFVPPPAPAATPSARPSRPTVRAIRDDEMSGLRGRDEATEPRRPDGDGDEDGCPGMVVFSGGTAFNAASAEMARRGTGGRDPGPDDLADLLAAVAAGSTSPAREAREDALRAALGGTKVWHLLLVC